MRYIIYHTKIFKDDFQYRLSQHRFFNTKSILLFTEKINYNLVSFFWEFIEVLKWNKCIRFQSRNRKYSKIFKAWSPPKINKEIFFKKEKSLGLNSRFYFCEVRNYTNFIDLVKS
jgi:hypothetical protein